MSDSGEEWKVDFEAKLLEQEHRPTHLLRNFFKRKRWVDGDPRRDAVVNALAWRILFAPATITVIGGAAGGLIVALLTLHYMSQQTDLLADQNKLIGAQNTNIQQQLSEMQEQTTLQRNHANTQRRTQLVAWLFEAKDSGPIAPARIREEALKEFLQMERARLGTNGVEAIDLSRARLEGTTISDEVFTNAQNLDLNVAVYEKTKFWNCRFFNQGFSEAFKDTVFKNCVFVDCVKYAHALHEVQFVGCLFINGNLFPDPDAGVHHNVLVRTAKKASPLSDTDIKSLGILSAFMHSTHFQGIVYKVGATLPGTSVSKRLLDGSSAPLSEEAYSITWLGRYPIESHLSSPPIICSNSDSLRQLIGWLKSIRHREDIIPIPRTKDRKWPWGDP